MFDNVFAYSKARHVTRIVSIYKPPSVCSYAAFIVRLYNIEMEAILGDTLVNGAGEEVTVASLCGPKKYVGKCSMKMMAGASRHVQAA